MVIEKQRADIKDLLELLKIEENLVGIEAGDLVFFKQMKLDSSALSGVVARSPGYYYNIRLTLTWKPDSSYVGMFLGTDSRYMRFLIEEKIVEFDTKFFGTVWTVRKPDQ